MKKFMVKLFKLLFIVLPFIFLFLLILKWYPKNNIFCENPVKLEDYSNRKKLFTICKDKIYYGNELITDRNKSPEIFDSKVAIPKLEVTIYSINKQEFIAIFPVADMFTWYARGANIFVKENGRYKEIFKRGIDELSGRWRGVRIVGTDSIYSFDPKTIIVNQDLGQLAFEGNRILWSDYYDLNEKNFKYVLANDKHRIEFEQMKKNYEELDLKSCAGESPTLSSQKISDLYPSRKSFIHFCFNESIAPYISKDQATIFLKGKKAVDLILAGKNLSMDDIKNVKLEDIK
ncbi:MAG: hypothetical protein ACD_26C00031G0003 [uncultured bacterium]|nr:MAG: hypothetical protein ACD_26C00031G0003 [uncultured bacterium]